MAYKRELEPIFELFSSVRNALGAGRVMTRRSGRLGRRTVSLPVLLAAPVLLALGFGESRTDSVEWTLPEIVEPSDVVYHPTRRTLFVVGDEGDLAEVSLDGKLLRTAHLGGDLEAITVDPVSGSLFVAREGHEIILEVKPDNFRLLRRFTIDRSFGGDPNYLKRGGDGVEGLAYVPDEKDPEGGHLWIVNQYDPPVLAELDIALRTSKDKFLTARLARVLPIDAAPLSGVLWRAESREFLIVSALWKRVSVIGANGHPERSVRIPGFLPEGIATLPDGRFAIAQDSGGLMIWKPEADPFALRAASPAPSGRAVGFAPVAGSAGVH